MTGNSARRRARAESPLLRHPAPDDKNLYLARAGNQKSRCRRIEYGAMKNQCPSGF